MSRTKQALLSSCCLLALWLSVVGAHAQKQTQEKMPAPEGVLTGVVMTRVPADGPPDQISIVTGGPGESYGFSFLSTEMSFDGQVVKGAPYTAEAVSESVQTLADGNRLVRKSTTLISRDSEGRTRREVELNNVGPFATTGDTPHLIFINDPVAGTNYSLDTRTHMARKGQVFSFTYERTEQPAAGAAAQGIMLSEPNEAGLVQSGAGGLRRNAIKRVQPVYPDVAKAAGAQGLVTVQIVIDEKGAVTSARAVSGHQLLQQPAVDAARQWVFKPIMLEGKPVKATGTISFSFVLDKNDGAAPEPTTASTRPQPVKESLGRQTIEGVEADGTRMTLTIPAGQIGNERPISIVTERWYSPELQTVVMTKHSDPRFGETTYRLTNINRSEPAHNLFEVPPDYTIKAAEPMRHEFRLRQPSDNEQ